MKNIKVVGKSLKKNLMICGLCVLMLCGCSSKEKEQCKANVSAFLEAYQTKDTTCGKYLSGSEKDANVEFETKDYDSRIILSSNLDDIYSSDPAIFEDILFDEMNNSEVLYAEILDMFYNCIQSGWTEYNEMPTLYSDKFCYLFPMYYSNPSYMDKIGYSFIDLNRDGIEELLIGMDSEEETQYGDTYQNMIYDLYTYMNDKVVHLATSGERFVYHLCEDNTIYYWGSSGAASTAYYHYQLSPDAPTFTILEGVYSDPDENWENVYWYYSTSGWYNPETYSNEGEEFTNISEDEANGIKNAWPQKVDFSVTYFSEYTPQNK